MEPSLKFLNIPGTPHQLYLQSPRARRLEPDTPTFFPQPAALLSQGPWEEQLPT